MVTVLRSDGHMMSVGDSAEEFISIHALRRERLLVLSCGLQSHPLKSGGLFGRFWNRPINNSLFVLA